MEKKTLCIIVVLFLCTLFISSEYEPNIERDELELKNRFIPTIVTQDPFYIYGNDMLLEFAEEENWPGAGTSGNPIRIEGYYFQNQSHILTVSHTTLHFVFRNNILDGMDDYWCVIVLTNVTNAIIEDNIIMNGAVGAHIIKTNDTIITNNEIYGQSWDAVYMETDCYNNIIENNYFHDMYEAGVWSWNRCSENVIQNNVIHDVMYGVSFRDEDPGNSIHNNTIFNASIAGVYTSCNETVITQNIIHDVGGSGITVKSKFNTISQNWVYDTGGYGLYMLDMSDASVITNNTFIRNEDGGIRLRTSEDNLIFSNNVFENGLPQILDDGTNNSYCYNYWHESQGEDLNNDGYFDLPYMIPGEAESVDEFSKIIPNNPFPLWYDYGNVSYPIITSQTTTPLDTSSVFSTTPCESQTSVQEITSTVTTTPRTSPISPDLMIPALITGTVVVAFLGSVLVLKKIIEMKTS